MLIKYKICSFFGHSEISITDDLKMRVRNKIENMIVKDNYGIFYFGGFSMFDELCYKIVSELKNKYPHLKRVFCLADPRHINVLKRPKWLREEEYEEYIYIDLKFDWYYTRIYYRNVEMINESDFVIFYFTNTKNSGAYKAYKYAIKKKKHCLNIAQEKNLI